MRSDTLPGRFGTIVSMTLGFHVLYIFGCLILGSLIIRNVPEDPELRAFSVATVDGQPMKYRWTNYGFDTRTLDDKPLVLRDDQSASLGTFLGARPEDERNRTYKYLMPNWGIVSFYFGAGGPGRLAWAEPWYLVQKKQGDYFESYFVAYTNRSCSPVKYVGTQGDTQSKPTQEQQFQVPLITGGIFTDTGTSFGFHPSTILDTASVQGTALNDYVAILSERGLEYVYLKSGKTVLVLPETGLFAINSLWPARIQAGQIQQHQVVSDGNVLMLRGADLVYQVKNQETIGRFTIPEKLKDRQLSVIPQNPDSVAYVTPLNLDAEKSRAFLNVVQCNAAGQIQKQWEVDQPLIQIVGPYRNSYLPSLVVCPAPVSIAVILGFIKFDSDMTANEILYWAGPTIGLLILCGLLSAAGAWWLGPRFSGQTAGWGSLIAVFCFGVPGLVGYLMHFRRPRKPVLEPALLLGTEVFG